MRFDYLSIYSAFFLRSIAFPHLLRTRHHASLEAPDLKGILRPNISKSTNRKLKQVLVSYKYSPAGPVWKG